MRLLLLLCVSMAAAAEAAPPPGSCGRGPLFTATEADGSHVDLVMSEDDVKSAPLWVPGRGEPPLSIDRLVGIAATWAATNHGRFDELRIRQITLRSMPCIGVNNEWYYQVDFDAVLGGERLAAYAHFIAVLMDGRVVVPRRVSGGS